MNAPSATKPTFRGEFLASATRPSVASLVGTLVVMAVCWGMCIAFVTPRFVSRHAAYIQLDNEDEYPALTAKVLAISQMPTADQQTPTSVTLIGDSAFREGFTTPQEMQQDIAAAGADDVKVNLLAAGNLTAWDMVAATDAIRNHVRGLVVLEIAPYFLAVPASRLNEPATMRLGVRSDAFDDEVRMAHLIPRFRIGNYFLDNLQFFVARDTAVSNLWRGPHYCLQHVPIREWRDRNWQQHHQVITVWTPRYATTVIANLQVYARIIARLHDRHIRVALLQAVDNPHNKDEWIDSGNPDDLLTKIQADYAVRARRFAADLGAPYLDLQEEAKLTQDDFVDYIHLKGQATERYTKVMALHCAQLLKEDEPDGHTPLISPATATAPAWADQVAQPPRLDRAHPRRKHQDGAEPPATTEAAP